MTLTYELDLRRVRLYHHAKYPRQAKVISFENYRPDQDTHTTDPLLYTATEVVGKMTIIYIQQYQQHY